MKVEGQVRIPSGCAIAAVISKEGRAIPGGVIAKAMVPMHDRSNGLGGGFAGYGMYVMGYPGDYLDITNHRVVSKKKFVKQYQPIDDTRVG